MLSWLGSASQPSMRLMGAVMQPLRPGRQPVKMPTGVQQQPPTPLDAVDKELAALRAKREEWANTPAPARASLLRRGIKLSYEATEAAAELAAAAKGTYGSGLGDERLLLSGVVFAMREYAEILETGGSINRTYQRESGQWVADVVPQGLEGVFYGGFSGSVWIQPGKEPTRAPLYSDIAAGKRQQGALSLVLGAGNQVCVVVLDILHMLLAENCCVICKLNPVQDYLHAFISQSLAPFIEAGCLAVVCGGPEQGKHLCGHPAVERVHLTGSAQTYDAIVWQGQPKVGSPPLRKPVSAELGCVTPYIVTPGRWSEAALQYHADECVASLVMNAGHNCLSPELLVTCKEWPQRQRFVQAVRDKLAAAPRRVAWYPGSFERHAAFRQQFPDAEELGQAAPEAAGEKPPAYLPWLLQAGLAPEQAQTQTETWCGVLQEVCLSTAADAASFLPAAVAFANDKCWGTLSCSLICPPDADPQARDAAIEGLKYGLVAVNCPTFLGFAFGKLSWGAFPGHTPQDVQSGVGCVHNALLLQHPQKSVLTAPWTHHPTHAWSPSARNVDATSKQLVRFGASPGLLTLGATALAALRN